MWHAAVWWIYPLWVLVEDLSAPHSSGAANRHNRLGWYLALINIVSGHSVKQKFHLYAGEQMRHSIQWEGCIEFFFKCVLFPTHTKWKLLKFKQKKAVDLLSFTLLLLLLVHVCLDLCSLQNANHLVKCPCHADPSARELFTLTLRQLVIKLPKLLKVIMRKSPHLKVTLIMC